MSITWTNFRGYLNEAIGDVPISVTTTSAGDTDKTTAISTALLERIDDFGENGLDTNSWLFWGGVVVEERRIANIIPDVGKIVVHRPFTSAVATATAVEIHKYKVSDKLKAANRTLEEIYHRRDFYNPVYSTALYGQNEYGEPDEEFRKTLYTVPSTFIEFPHIMLVRAYTGQHTGDDDAAVLTDSSKSWKTNELVGLTIYNKTDGSYGTVLSNTSTTVTATEAGGTGNDWDEDDEYIIQDPRYIPEPFTDYTRIDNSGMKFHAYIPEEYLLIMQGRGPLTAFTTAAATSEASTTELENDEARIVAYYAAYCLFDTYANMVSQRDRSEYEAAAQKSLGKYMAFRHPMDQISCMTKVDSSWM